MPLSFREASFSPNSGDVRGIVSIPLLIVRQGQRCGECQHLNQTGDYVRTFQWTARG